MTPLLRIVRLAAFALAFACLLTVSAQAVDGRNTQESHLDTVKRVNGGRVGIISGGIGGTYIPIATDLASVLDDGGDVRILPIMGKASVQNITDIVYLKSIHIGIVQSDVLCFMKRKQIHYNLSSRIHYITKLYNEEFHLVSSGRTTSVQQLVGQNVNFGVKGSGTDMTAQTVFAALDIEVVPVHYDQALALEKIKQGEIAATVYVAGKPARAVTELKATDGLRLIPVPYEDNLQESYLPARLSPQDYPNLVKQGQTVDTIAIGAVMAVFNWPPGSSRYDRVVKFIDAFFSKFWEFRKEPRHRKWREVNLAAKLPGWTRFPYAEQWLAKNPPAAPVVSEKQDFRRYVTAQGAMAEIT
jgi:TRAP transporter TAXI family solute receptor